MQFQIKGHQLRAMRLEAAMTTRQMADLAGVKTRKTYENWERGTGTPNINQFLAMAEGCGYELEPIQLWFNDKPKNK